MRGWLLGLALLTAPVVLAHKPTTTKFTYHADVYPIVRSKCGDCHRPGGVGPMSLLTYQETFPWAVSIKNEVLSLRMPPWFADERYGEFEHRSALSASEVNTIVDWCLGGAPEGEPSAEAEAAPEPGWMLGEPDVVLAMPEPFTLGSDRSEAIEDVSLSSGLRRDRWVKAIDVRPGSPNVVRSVLVFREKAAPENLIAAWVPGSRAEALSRGAGVRIGKRAALVLRIHYKKTWLDEGKDVSDLSQVALYFQQGKTERSVDTIVVRPAEKNAVERMEEGFVATVQHELPRAVDVLALLPLVDHELTAFRAEAVLPGGEVRELIRLREPDPDWPRKFWLTSPVSLPARSRVRLIVTASEEEPLRGANVLLLDVTRD